MCEENTIIGNSQSTFMDSNPDYKSHVKNHLKTKYPQTEVIVRIIDSRTQLLKHKSNRVWNYRSTEIKFTVYDPLETTVNTLIEWYHKTCYMNKKRSGNKRIYYGVSIDKCDSNDSRQEKPNYRRPQNGLEIESETNIANIMYNFPDPTKIDIDYHISGP